MLDVAKPEAGAATATRDAARPTLDARKGEGGLVLNLAGDWLARTVGSIEALLEETRKAELGRAVTMNCAGIGKVDTSGAFLIERLSRSLGARGVEVTLDGVSRQDLALFEAVRRALDRERPQQVPAKAPMLVRVLGGIGESAVTTRDEVIAGLNIIGGSIYGAGRRISGKTQVRPAAIFNQMDKMGVRAVPIIMLMSFLIGGIIAQQGAFQLRRFGGEVYAVNLAGILVLREIGVLLTAIMIAGRSGSAITAEIGSMKMREEVDALHVIGLNPIGVLIFPRLVALTIVLPLLTFLANMAALGGAMVTLSLYSGITPTNFLSGLQSSIDLFTVFAGLIKAPFMAIIIGLVASLEGMKVGGSAESLGLHVTASVVKAIFLVILMDGIFAIFYASLGL